MTKALTLTLVDDLSRDQADSTLTGRMYDDLVRELGRTRTIVRASLIETVAGTAVYAQPTTSIERLATFHDTSILDELSLQELESLNHQWKDEKGPPIALTTEELAEKSFRVFPVPETGSGTVAGGDFGTGFIVNALSSIHTNFEADLPEWIELPLAFAILAMEFSRESDHRDIDFANFCAGFADFLFEMVKVSLKSEVKNG
ncbi:MAG: hypothetical protein V3W09_04140 [Nitrososphaerales archaeon]